MNLISSRQQIFIDEFIVSGNASLAYSLAYGHDINNCREMAHILLKNKKVAAEIELKKAELAKKYNITQEYLIEELFQIIKSCKEDAKKEIGITDRGNWNKAIQTLAKITGFDIKKIEVSDKTVIKIITDKFLEEEDTVEYVEYDDKVKSFSIKVSNDEVSDDVLSDDKVKFSNNTPENL